LGVGFFQWRPDHLQEVPEKILEKIRAASPNNGNGKL
jgi:elongation factor G